MNIGEFFENKKYKYFIDTKNLKHNIYKKWYKDTFNSGLYVAYILIEDNVISMNTINSAYFDESEKVIPVDVFFHDNKPQYVVNPEYKEIIWYKGIWLI